MWYWESTVRSDLEAVLTVMLHDISSQRNSEPGYTSSEGIIENFLSAATFSKIEGHAGACMSFEDFRSWCCLLPSVRKYLGSLLMPSDPGLLSIFIWFVLLIDVFFIYFFTCWNFFLSDNYFSGSYGIEFFDIWF